MYFIAAASDIIGYWLYCTRHDHDHDQQWRIFIRHETRSVDNPEIMSFASNCIILNFSNEFD